MKNFIPVLALCILFLMSCNNEELIVVDDQKATSIENIDFSQLYTSSASDAEAYKSIDPEMQQIIMDLMSNDYEPTLNNRSGNTHVNGHFTSYEHDLPTTAFYKSEKMTIGATQNSQGVSGTMHMTRTWGDAGEFEFQVILDVDCLMVNGDDAIVSGIITQVTGDEPGVFSAGTRGWYRVKDNGHGPNADPDQSKGILIFNPSGVLPCAVFGFTFPLWNFLPYLDVVYHSDNINVN